MKGNRAPRCQFFEFYHDTALSTLKCVGRPYCETHQRHLNSRRRNPGFHPTVCATLLPDALLISSSTQKPGPHPCICAVRRGHCWGRHGADCQPDGQSRAGWELLGPRVLDRSRRFHSHWRGGGGYQGHVDAPSPSLMTMWCTLLARRQGMPHAPAPCSGYEHPREGAFTFDPFKVASCVLLLGAFSACFAYSPYFHSMVLAGGQRDGGSEGIQKEDKDNGIGIGTWYRYRYWDQSTGATSVQPQGSM